MFKWTYPRDWKKMKIYDCFTFFNELDLLKIRLEELYPYVDYFVLVEANKTFSGKEKRFYFEKNKEKFERWLNKIIYIKIKNMPKMNKTGEFIQKIANKLNRFIPLIPLNGLIIHTHLGRWKLQNYQRNQIMQGLKNCNDEDIIIISDVDEIPNPKVFPRMKELLKKYNRVEFRQKYYCYYLNGLVHNNWKRVKACKFKTLKNEFGSKPQEVRGGIRDSQFLKKIIKRKEVIPLIDNGGWHFTYVGDIKKIMQKISSLSAAERDNKKYNHPLRLKELIKNGKYLINESFKIKYKKIDNSFPTALQIHKKEYQHLIKE